MEQGEKVREAEGDWIGMIIVTRTARRRLIDIPGVLALEQGAQPLELVRGQWAEPLLALEQERWAAVEC